MQLVQFFGHSLRNEISAVVVMFQQSLISEDGQGFAQWHTADAEFLGHFLLTDLLSWR